MKRFCYGVLPLMVMGTLAIFFGSNQVVAKEMPTMMDLIEESNYDVLEENKPKSAILIDANTGKFLWGDNPDEPHNPASIMKLMVLYLVYEAIEKGEFDFETTVVATERHQQISSIYELSNNKIVAGVAYPVEELIPMTLVPSSNVTTLMLAELIEPDANNFLDMMNNKAKELGMTNTKIVNVSGAEISAFQGLYSLDTVDKSQLDIEGSNSSTARDFSIFTYHLVNDYPEILEYTKTPTVKTMIGTDYEEGFDTYNFSLPGLEYAYDGVDGLKTGSSSSGAFNLDVTAQRGELRLIALVFGVGDWATQIGEKERHPFANSILDYGFNHFEYKEILSVGEMEINDKTIEVKTPIKEVIRKGEIPTFQLDNDHQIIAQNSLEEVSNTIPSQSAEYVEIKKTIVEEKKEQVTDLWLTVKDVLDFSNPLIRWLTIAFGTLFLLIVLVIILLIKDGKKRKRAKQ